jgi:DNA-binding protein H-NS
MLISKKEQGPERNYLQEATKQQRYEDSFYFYGKVYNPRRGWTKATQVQVFLVREEERLPNGEYHVISTRETPIVWHLQEVKPTHATIGHEATFVICSIVKDKWIEIHPLVKPYILPHKELAQMEARIARLKIERQNSERTELRQRILEMVKQAGFEISDLFGKGSKGKGAVAVKYRDPQNPENTWTGRGRMPRWLAAATKGGKVKKDDFLI